MIVRTEWDTGSENNYSNIVNKKNKKRYLKTIARTKWDTGSENNYSNIVNKKNKKRYLKTIARTKWGAVPKIIIQILLIKRIRNVI